MSKLRSSAGTGHLQLDVDECPQCAGLGVVELEAITADCPACKGIGRYQGEERELCPNCRGTGRSLRGGRCYTCVGTGIERESTLGFRHLMMAGPVLAVGAWLYALAQGVELDLGPFLALGAGLFAGGLALQVRHHRRRTRLNANRERPRLK